MNDSDVPNHHGLKFINKIRVRWWNAQYILGRAWKQFSWTESENFSKTDSI